MDKVDKPLTYDETLKIADEHNINFLKLYVATEVRDAIDSGNFEEVEDICNKNFEKICTWVRDVYLKIDNDELSLSKISWNLLTYIRDSECKDIDKLLKLNYYQVELALFV